jgi:hypothetical protein
MHGRIARPADVSRSTRAGSPVGGSTQPCDAGGIVISSNAVWGRLLSRRRFDRGSGTVMLQANVSGQGAFQFVAGKVLTPGDVQAQLSTAAYATNGRLQTQAVIQQPRRLGA